MSVVIRFLRIAPMMMYITALNWKISDQLPWSYNVDSNRDYYDDACSQTWYSILFFYQNLRKHDHDCMGHLWYLQCDMQMFLLLPFLCLIYHYYKKIGIFASLVPTITCIIVRIHFAFYYNFSYLNSAALNPHPIKHDGNFMKDSYTKPWTRMAPYFIGVTTMFVILYINDNFDGYKVSKRLYWILMIIGGLILTLLVFLPYDDMKDAPLYKWTTFEDSFMYVINRPLWGFGLTLLFIALYYKPNNIYSITNKLLSFEMYQAIGKLTFTMYLIHMPIYYWWIESTSLPRYYSYWNIILLFCGISALTLFITLILWFIIEKPIANIVTHIINIISCKNKYKKRESLLPFKIQPTDQQFSMHSRKSIHESISVQ